MCTQARGWADARVRGGQGSCSCLRGGWDRRSGQAAAGDRGRSVRYRRRPRRHRDFPRLGAGQSNVRRTLTGTPTRWRGARDARAVPGPSRRVGRTDLPPVPARGGKAPRRERHMPGVPSPSMTPDTDAAASIGRRSAVAQARHYREAEGLPIAQIAKRLGRSPATVKAYFYDPTGEKARAVKARYQGVCRGCGAYPRRRGGKGDVCAYCKGCPPGAIQSRWTRQRVLEAMRAWHSRYGSLPSSYDWSRTHALRRGGEALERLTDGEWPSASVVTNIYGSWAEARAAADHGAATRERAEVVGRLRAASAWRGTGEPRRQVGAGFLRVSPCTSIT